MLIMKIQWEENILMALADEILDKSKVIVTDGYPMSIGELINLYEDGDLEIHPDFQRFFRWTDGQKDKLIESILLGIPIPSIFVSQNEDGIWDVIDGLQRLSTILEFVGVLKDAKGSYLPPRILDATDFLPSLQNKVFSSDFIGSDNQESFTSAQRRDFKRTKMNVSIIKKTSDDDVKYELFQRLNTGGTPLSSQEIRNCLMIMIDRDFYKWFEELYADQNFNRCFVFSEKQKEEREDMEFLLRYLIYRYSLLNGEISTNEEMGDYLTTQMRKMISDAAFDRHKEKKVFEKTFLALNNILGEDSFKKYNIEKERFSGASLISCFEAITPGLSKKLEESDSYDNDSIKRIIMEIPTKVEFSENTYRGIKAIKRMKGLLKLSLEMFV